MAKTLKGAKATSERVKETTPGNATPPSWTPDKQSEQLEFENVTEFRKSILEAIPRLQENKYLRFVLTKHGEPAAVVMSYEAFEIFREAAEQAVQKDSALSSEQSLQDAYARMRQKYWPEADAQKIPPAVDPLKSYIHEVVYDILSKPISIPPTQTDALEEFKRRFKIGEYANADCSSQESASGFQAIPILPAFLKR